jgi:hypothetical protein
MKVPMVAVRHHYDKANAVEYKPGESFHAEGEAAAARLVRLKRARHAPPPPAPRPPKVVTKVIAPEPLEATPSPEPLEATLSPEPTVEPAQPAAAPSRRYTRRDMRAEGQ